MKETRIQIIYPKESYEEYREVTDKINAAHNKSVRAVNAIVADNGEFFLICDEESIDFVRTSLEGVSDVNNGIKALNEIIIPKLYEDNTDNKA